MDKLKINFGTGLFCFVFFSVGFDFLDNNLSDDEHTLLRAVGEVIVA